MTKTSHNKGTMFRTPAIMLFLAASLNISAQSRMNDTVNYELRRLNERNLILHIDTFGTKVVAASRSPRNMDELPVTIYVISHEEIIRNHTNTLAEVLKSIPGVRISLAGSGETGETFLLRGLTGNYYTKILVNGQPVKPSVAGAMPIGFQLPLRQAERIEIVCGPSAAVYGADAISGVINIITREAEKGTFAQADLGLGTNGFSQMNFSIGGKAGRNKNLLQYSFYGSKTELNRLNIKYKEGDFYNPLYYFQKKREKFTLGLVSYNPLDITEGTLTGAGTTSASFIREYYPARYAGGLTFPDMSADLSTGAYMIGLNLNFRGVGISYLNMYRHTHSSIGKSPLFFRYNDPNAFWGDYIQSLVMSYTTPVSSRFSSTTSLNLLKYRMDNNSNFAVTFHPTAEKLYQYSASDDYLFEEVLTFTPRTNLELLGGLSYQLSSNLPRTNYLLHPFNTARYNPYGSTSFPTDSLLGDFGFNPFFFHNLSVFNQIYWVVKGFRLMGGIRYDMNSFYGNSLNPRIAAMVSPDPKTTIRISAGTAFKAPPSSVSFESLAFRTGLHADSVNYLILPNKNLRPEHFLASELSIQRKVRRNLTLTGNLYFYQVQNMINFNSRISVNRTLYPLSVNDSASTKMNEKDAVSRLYGFQTTLQWTDIIRTIGLSGELTLTFNADRNKNLPNVSDIVGNFKLMPRHFGQLCLTATPVKNLYLRMESTWMTKWMRVLIPFEGLYKNLFKNVDGYYTMDFTADYRFGVNLRGYISIVNVFDEKYGMPITSGSDMDLVSVPQPGRNLRFGFTYTLN
ncbi:MAG: TonB-dependent receptor [Bacteroidales bacterium]|nr:TonB-dependent receptor [Bacteroidales bacterium]